MANAILVSRLATTAIVFPGHVSPSAAHAAVGIAVVSLGNAVVGNVPRLAHQDIFLARAFLARA